MQSPGRDSGPPQPPRRAPQPAMHDSQVADPVDASSSSDGLLHLKSRENPPFDVRAGRTNRRAWLGSTLLHTALILAVAALWQPVTKGTGEQRDRPAGLALAHHKTSGVEYELQGGGNESNTDSSMLNEAIQSQASATNSNAAADASMQELLGPLADVLSGVAVSGANAGSVGDAGLSGQGSGGDTRGHASKTKTSFMGIEGQGSSFVYVVDYSESMSTYSGTPMVRAKSELAYSIQSLGRVNQFQIVFYNDQPSRYFGSLGNSSGLIFANDVEKEAATSYVKNVLPIGGTEHYRALLLALDLKPDVIFFLTDGADPSLSQRQIDQVISRADANQTTIHAVQFGVGSNRGDGRWIEQLSQRARGKFRYVDVSKISTE